ncbi:DUF2306 domain-containing protein [Microbacterium sp. SS28]|uniref:DUF2306 domain-containing protein n=1 Tax=Microbacterium sp. SS28 TaxID=2919948 RepID=UPI001FAADE01|nr:DUF2306 domain-containing protein [Microbacterium sp. SS28]
MTDRLLAPAPAAASRLAPRRAAGRIGWLVVALTALAIVAYAAVPYFLASLPQLAGEGGGLAGHYAGQPMFVQVALYAHIAGAAIALLLGPLQFWRGLRERAPRVHRWTGRTYLAGVAIGGAASLVIAPFGSAGFVGFFGFGALGVLWLVTGWRAYRSIRRGDVPSHQAWMIRNYALTYAAVTLRVWLPMLLVVQIPFGSFEFDAAFANAYAAVPFLCWLPNLVVAEWLVRRRGLPSYRLTPASVR